MTEPLIIETAFGPLRIDDPNAVHRSFSDHERYCHESLRVQNKLGVMVPMQLGPAQKKLNAIVERCREKGKPVRIVAPKARQVWISVGVAAQFFQGTAALAGQHTLVLANDEATALNLFQHYQRFADHYRPFGGAFKLPAVLRNTKTEIEWTNGSWIKAHTTRTLSIGRSFTLRRVHFSEAAYYSDLKTTMTAVMAAVPADKDTMVVVESTPNGIGNEFHRLCLSAYEGRSEWELLFIAWWENPEYSRPLADPGKFQATLSREEIEMMRQYGLQLEQLHWRRWAIANICNGDAELFKQEYPGNFHEGFLASGRPRFSLAAIQRMPLVHDAVQGGLEETVYAGSPRIHFMPRERGELTLFRKPDPAKTYVIGADSAEGIDTNEGEGEADPDYSVAIVRERESGDQAATLRGRIEPAEFGRYIALLGRWYNNACLIPEANNTGIATIDALLIAGYPPSLIYHRMREPDDDPKVRADKIGWKTTTVTRPQLISWYDNAIREMSIYIRDPQVASEAQTFVIKPNGKAEAQKGCHDDCVIADALTVIAMMQMPKPKAPADALPKPQLSRYGRSVESDSRGERLRLR
ncbi:MAG TPA: hypothetical protein VI454_17215 [Verrucomicrobiae bacterium]|jgi:hypothetical protein